MSAAARVPFLVPAGLAAPTGGNRYDQRLLAGLPQLRAVTVTAPAELAAALAAVPDGGVVLLDGLVATPHPALLAAAAARVRPVLLVHLLRADDDPPAGVLADEVAALRHVAAVIATSTSSAARLRALSPGLTSLAVAEPGTDPAPASRARGAHRLLSVGSVTPRKGQHLAAAAVEALAGPWSLRCAGTVAPTPGGAGVAASERVRLLGPLDARELAEEWARTDLHVLLSSAEPYGMAVAEALARGVPSLVARAGEL
ncbi:glycosyltransferase, partial [Kineococcus sp. R8]|uniref:glycosyltransferase n=1 Tax=Kineococcus siccus TaxID=2696567 RepID=UPI001412B7B7|nr:glycosyltransferase [Kineococcus siccus]